jgi:predicted nucleotidyltransferase
MTTAEREGVAQAALVFREMGATGVYVFGSAARGNLREDSDIDMAVSGLPPHQYFPALGRAAIFLDRPIDLVDLDDSTPLVNHLRNCGDLVLVD